MTIIRYIPVLVIPCLGLVASAKKKKIQDYPRAEIKVSYNYHHLALRNDGEVITSD